MRYAKMKRTWIKQIWKMQWLLGLGLWLGIILLSMIPASRADDAHLYFLAISGETLEGKTSVLLRWYSFGAPIPIEQFLIYRKQGDASSLQPMQLVSKTQKLRNEPLVRTLFDQPRMERAKTNLYDTLSSMLDVPVTDENFVQQLFTILDGDDSCDECEFRSEMLANANYGVAIVQGNGYLDAVSPDTYTYELRSEKSDGEVVLGRVTIDATKPTQLEAPQQPLQVDVPGERGDLRVFLNWKFSDALHKQRTAFFGYNVYRGEGDLTGQDFETLFSEGKLKKINRLPVLPPSGEAIGDKPEDQYVFVDDNQQLTKNGPEGTPFEAGEVHTYWVAAIDLLGQNGKPSDPVAALVPDKSAPRVPRSLNTKVVDVSGVKRVVLGWERNPDDTVNYKVYRFREWDHVSKKDAFPPVDGLTEGFVSDVPQPGSESPFFLDTTINVVDQENKAFWYCVCAVDLWGNESALSPPFRGVIFDKTPPNAPQTALLCTEYNFCSIHFRDLTARTDLRSETKGNLIVELNIARANETKTRQHIQVDRVTTYLATTANIPPVTATIYDGPYPGDSKLVIKDDIPAPNQTVRVHYRIRVINNDGSICSEIIVPDEKFYEQFQRYLREGISVGIYVEFTVETSYRCREVVTGVVDHTPYDPDGNPRPVSFQVPQAEDAVGVILYRSPDCEHYYRVSDQRFSSGSPQLTVEDYYVPEQGGRICYGIRYFDENNNLSPIFYIPTQILFPTLPTSGVTPSMISADPLGDETLPSVMLRWFGSNVGIAGFRVELATGVDFSGKLGTIQLSAPDYTYDQEDSEFETAIDHEDDTTGDKIKLDRSYYIRVVAVLQNGQERPSNNSLLFTWTSTVIPHEHPAWPIRPLPPTNSNLRAGWLPPVESIPTAQKFVYGAVIYIGYLDFTGAKESNATYEIKAPFIVYRRRIDIADKTFVQISPLIESISTKERDVPYDPFFTTAFGTFNPTLFPDLGNRRGIFYLDTVDLIYGAKYEYKIVKLNAQTGEIERVYGPSTPVEVLNP